MSNTCIKTDCVFFCQVEGKEAPGPLFDFGLLMFHCGKMLFENKSGPFFYLSKVTHTYRHIHKVCVILIWTACQLYFFSPCFPGGEFYGGQIMEQNLCLDTTEGLHTMHIS